MVCGRNGMWAKRLENDKHMYKVDPVTGHGCRDEIVLVYFSEFKYNYDVSVCI
jgi:hypothetical protein